MRNLRQLIEDWKESGELKLVEGMNCDLEIGGITEVTALGVNPPALLFYNIISIGGGFKPW